MRKFLFAAALGLTALAATPAAAQAYQGTPPPPEGYYDEGYSGSDEWAGDQGSYDQRGYDQQDYRQQGYQGARRYQPGDYYQGGGQPLAGDPRGYARDGRRYRPRRCSSTGTILGGIAGALIGGEVGRGDSRWSRRSGTGTVVGAGVGALIGSEIDRSNCEDRYNGYRR